MLELEEVTGLGSSDHLHVMAKLLEYRMFNGLGVGEADHKLEEAVRLMEKRNLPKGQIANMLVTYAVKGSEQATALYNALATEDLPGESALDNALRSRGMPILEGRTIFEDKAKDAVGKKVYDNYQDWASEHVEELLAQFRRTYRG